MEKTNLTKEQLEELAREYRRRKCRKWRKAHPEKQKEYWERYQAKKQLEYLESVNAQ